MVYHDDTTGGQNRTRVMARISMDDGATWSGGLLLGSGAYSYPSASQSEDGVIHVVFDQTTREVHPRMYHTSFTEEEVLAGDSTTEVEKNLVCLYMGEPVYHKIRTMAHSGVYSSYADGLTAADAHSRGEADAAEFWYQYGMDFNFTNLTNMEPAPYWRNSDDTNRVAAWYMTASGASDAAISWHSYNHANVTDTTTFGDVYLTNGSGSAQVMAVQKRGNEYYPLWPVQGEFQWQTIEDGQRISLAGDNAIETVVKPGDEIIVVLRSGSSQITMNPQVTYTTKEADSSIAINPLADSLFMTFDKMKLQSLYDNNKKKEQGDYTDESWKQFTGALAAADSVLKNPEATKEQVEKAMSDLERAIEGLTLKAPEPSVDKTQLQSLYDNNKKKEQGDYTDESWKQFTGALAAADSVLKNPEATKEQVEKAMSDLERAIEGLTLKAPEPSVDKTQFQSLYDNNETKEQGDYTDESWKQFTGALAAADSVLKNPEATKEQVEKARSDLQAAINNLKLSAPHSSSSTNINSSQAANSDSKNPEGPSTGDTSHNGIVMMLAVLCLGTVAGITLLIRRRSVCREPKNHPYV